MTSLLLMLFVKDRHNTASPAVRASVGRLAGVTGIVCNLLLFLAKLTVGLLAGAVSIIADAANNLSDASSSVVTLIGFRLSQKPADKDHPYGHARYEYIAGLLVSVIILVIGVQLGMEAIQKILHPSVTTLTLPTLIILSAAILVKLWMMLFYRSLGKRIGSATLRATAIDARNDALATTVVLLSCVAEHVFAVHIDGVAGLAVAVFILYSGCRLVGETISPLIGQGADPETVKALKALILSHEKVLGIHDLLIHDYGPGRRFASVHAELNAADDPIACHAVIDSIEHEALDRMQIRLVIHCDPVDTTDEERTALHALTERLVTAIDARMSLHDFHVVTVDGVTRLHFDLTLPYALHDKHAVIQTRLESALAAHGAHYETVIDFDETE